MHNMVFFRNFRKLIIRRTLRFNIKSIVTALVLAAIVQNGGILYAQSANKVYGFDIDGLKLNMNLDTVIKLFNVNNIRTNKDMHGIVNGYEIKKRIKERRVIVVLSFTGEKRLYRIHYSTILDKYRHNAKKLYEELTKKYGSAWSDNINSIDTKKQNITACWGSSCRRYPRTSPILTAQIHHMTGRLDLMLEDSRIFNKDWKLYKQKLGELGASKNSETSTF